MIYPLVKCPKCGSENTSYTKNSYLKESHPDYIVYFCYDCGATYSSTENPYAPQEIKR